jgi:hypothetical protein
VSSRLKLELKQKLKLQVQALYVELLREDVGTKPLMTSSDKDKYSKNSRPITLLLPSDNPSPSNNESAIVDDTRFIFDLIGISTGSVKSNTLEEPFLSSV